VVAPLKKMKLPLEGGKLQFFFRNVMLQFCQVTLFELKFRLLRRKSVNDG